MNYKTKKLNVGILCTAIFLMIPAYYKVFNLNLHFLFSFFMVAVVCIAHGLRIYKIRFECKLYTFFLLFMAVHTTVYTGLKYGIPMFTTTIGLLYIVVISTRNKESFIAFINAMVNVSVALSIVAIFEEVMRYNWIKDFAPNDFSGSFMEVVRAGIFRVQTIFAQPIVFGWFMLIMSGIILYKVSISRGKIRQRAWVAYVLCCIAEVFAFSRSPLFGFVILQIVLLSRMKVISLKKSFLIKSGVIVTILGIIVLTSSSAKSAFSSFFESFFMIFKDSSETEGTYAGMGDRLSLFTWVMNSMNGNFLLGNNGTAFSYKVYDWFTKTSIENEYLNYFYNYGFIGLSLCIVSYISNIVCFYKKRNANEMIESSLGFNYMTFATLSVLYVFVFFSALNAALSIQIVLIGLATSMNLNSTTYLDINN